ncbi:DUF308 domain-containing protein [Bifidobacterium eulemuris]|uniref:DUF308 domain-containing protein n=1 Tax=Bifidobacterium eulemuris TaxID=1765219 RepID=A0A261G9X9_9BIFI|nr:DUF308 domain-containing protein [Bifidobacterium eulemuris]OZG68043.1 hypothetical protein BEUL_1054 [Bifidobacterium eulemuris]QOL31882.1 DUF308 domain-containing protein [Bifidobacterium eulemuris]
MSDETETTVMPTPADDERTQTIDAVPADMVDESQTVEESAEVDDLDMTKPLDELVQERAEQDAQNTQTVPQVPLYATQPPSGGSAARGGSVPQGGNPWAQPGPQPFVQVPPQPVTERPVIHKTGPSVATIVLGVLLAIMGVIAIVFGMETPILSLDFVADSRMMVGAIFGVVGGGLVLVAIIWGLVGLVRSKRQSAEDGEDSDSPATGE